MAIRDPAPRLPSSLDTLERRLVEHRDRTTDDVQRHGTTLRLGPLAAYEILDERRDRSNHVSAPHGPIHERPGREVSPKSIRRFGHDENVFAHRRDREYAAPSALEDRDRRRGTRRV